MFLLILQESTPTAVEWPNCHIIGIESGDTIEFLVEAHDGQVETLTCPQSVFSETWPDVTKASELEDSLPIHADIVAIQMSITQCTLKL